MLVYNWNVFIHMRGKIMIIIDLQSFMGVKKSIASLIKCDFHEFEQLIKKQILHETEDRLIDVELLVKEDIVDFDKFKLEDIYFKVYHFTTRSSKENCIQDIFDLPTALTTDTELRNFLASFDIEVFPDKQLIKIGTATMPISKKGEFNNIYSKLYVDPEVWGFLRTLDITEYQNVYPNFPEFINNIANVVEDKTEFESAWQSNHGNPFVIEFIHPYNKLSIYGNNIELSKDGFKKDVLINDVEFENYQKQGLIKLLLGLYFGMLKRCDKNELLAAEFKEYGNDRLKHTKLFIRLGEYLNQYDDEQSEIRTALDKGENVVADNIIKVWGFDDFQTEGKLGNCYIK